MPSTLSPTHGLELMQQGEKANQWGDITNANLSKVEQGVDGIAAFALTAADALFVVDPGQAEGANGRRRVLRFTDAGDSPAAVAVQITRPTPDPTPFEKLYFIHNSTVGVTLTIQQDSLPGTVEVPPGVSMAIHCDGVGGITNLLSNTVTDIVSNTVVANSGHFNYLRVNEHAADDTVVFDLGWKDAETSWLEVKSKDPGGGVDRGVFTFGKDSEIVYKTGTIVDIQGAIGIGATEGVTPATLVVTENPNPGTGPSSEVHFNLAASDLEWDLYYRGSTGELKGLPGNITTSTLFLSSVGNATNTTAMTWSPLSLSVSQGLNGTGAILLPENGVGSLQDYALLRIKPNGGGWELEENVAIFDAATVNFGRMFFIGDPADTPIAANTRSVAVSLPQSNPAGSIWPKFEVAGRGITTNSDDDRSDSVMFAIARRNQTTTGLLDADSLVFNVREDGSVVNHLAYVGQGTGGGTASPARYGFTPSVRLGTKVGYFGPNSDGVVPVPPDERSKPYWQSHASAALQIEKTPGVEVEAWGPTVLLSMADSFTEDARGSWLPSNDPTVDGTKVRHLRMYFKKVDTGDARKFGEYIVFHRQYTAIGSETGGVNDMFIYARINPVPAGNAGALNWFWAANWDFIGLENDGGSPPVADHWHVSNNSGGATPQWR